MPDESAPVTLIRLGASLGVLPSRIHTSKGNQYYFGAKAHIGIDSKEGVVHSVCTSAASVHDEHMLPDLLHGNEKKVWGDAGYQGQTEAIHEAAPQAQDMTNRRVKKSKGNGFVNLTWPLLMV